MPNTHYLISCAASSLGGLIVGIAIGSVLDGKLTGRVKRFVRGLPHRNAMVGALVVLGGILSTGMLYLQGQELEAQREQLARVVECQTKANEAFRDILAKRSGRSEEQRNAQLRQIEQQIAQNEGQDLLLSITSRDDPAGSVNAIVDYQLKLRSNTAALREAARALGVVQETAAQNPYPNLECGGL